MIALFLSLIGALRSSLHTQADLALENLALRQQLANLRRTSGRPRLRRIDPVFWHSAQLDRPFTPDPRLPGRRMASWRRTGHRKR